MHGRLASPAQCTASREATGSWANAHETATKVSTHRATHLKAASNFSEDVFHGHPGVLKVDLAGWNT